MPIDNHAQLSLLAHLRHELRTPMNAIIGYSEMLLEELEAEGDQELIEGIEKIQTNGTQLLSLINTILSPAKLEASQFDLDITILSETIRVELQMPLSAVIGYCEQLLEKVTVELVPDLEKIYTAAEHLQKEIDDIVNLSEQQVDFADPKEVITPDLPLEKNVNSATAQEVQTCVHSLNRDGDGKQAAKDGNILVVDDNETNRDLLSRQIEGQGYAVATAANGQQALQMIETGRYDLILLDIMMPEMNGYQVLKWLYDSPWRHIPAIMISALDEIDSVVKCIEMGAEDYLPKPFNPVLLRARIGACLEKKRLRDQEALYLVQLAQANQEITSLNERLKAENLRLSAELDVTRKLQQMILPREKELSQIDGLEISGFMEPADEVGGDYYDVLQQDGRVKIGIGDVTGHGLESGVLTIMVQTAVRTLMENNETDPKKFLDVLNRTIYKNVQRMSSEKNLTLSLVDYQDGKLSLSGQHEEIIVVRSDGKMERIDTIDLGFPIGLEEAIVDFVAQTQTHLNSGDVVVLYTDGITEAESFSGLHYGLERLCEVVRQNRQRSANEIRQVVIDDLRQHIGEQKVYDDITLLVLKQK